MKKYIAMLCATMLCVCCLGLAACGGSSSSSAASASASSASAASSEASASASAASSASASAASASASAASASASAASADPASKFAGDWKVAGMTLGGITFAGDLSAYMGSDADVAVSVKSDGTGTFTWAGEAIPFTWVATGDDSFEASLQSSAAGSGDDQASSLIESAGQTLNFKLENGVLSAIFEDGGQTGGLLFSKDGVLPGAPDYDPAKATPITQESDLIGTWNVVGAYMGGCTVFGSADDLASTIVGSQDMTMVFESGGKCSLGGTSSSTYTIGSDGATIQDSGMTMSVKKLGDKLILDFGDIMQTGSDMVLVYAKS
jgi:hypothetical protein